MKRRPAAGTYLLCQGLASTKHAIVHAFGRCSSEVAGESRCHGDYCFVCKFVLSYSKEEPAEQKTEAQLLIEAKQRKHEDEESARLREIEDQRRIAREKRTKNFAN